MSAIRLSGGECLGRKRFGICHPPGTSFRELIELRLDGVEQALGARPSGQISMSCSALVPCCVGARFGAAGGEEERPERF